MILNTDLLVKVQVTMRGTFGELVLLLMFPLKFGM